MRTAFPRKRALHILDYAPLVAAGRDGADGFAVAGGGPRIARRGPSLCATPGNITAYALCDPGAQRGLALVSQFPGRGSRASFVAAGEEPALSPLCEGQSPSWLVPRAPCQRVIASPGSSARATPPPARRFRARYRRPIAAWYRRAAPGGATMAPIRVSASMD